MTPSIAITRLLASDWSETEIGRHVGVAQSTISRIKNGRNTPSYTTAMALIELAKNPNKRRRKA